MVALQPGDWQNLHVLDDFDFGQTTCKAFTPPWLLALFLYCDPPGRGIPGTLLRSVAGLQSDIAGVEVPP